MVPFRNTPPPPSTHTHTTATGKGTAFGILSIVNLVLWGGAGVLSMGVWARSMAVFR